MFVILFIVILGWGSISCLLINNDKYVQYENNDNDITLFECLANYYKYETRYVIENGKITYIHYKA